MSTTAAAYVRRRPDPDRAKAGMTNVISKWCNGLQDLRIVSTDDGQSFTRLIGDCATVGVGVGVAVSRDGRAEEVGGRARPPLLVAKLILPGDTIGGIGDTIQHILDYGTPVVWVVDPYSRAVVVYGPGKEPVLYNRTQDLPGGAELPGFSCRVADIFE